ncbi:uncharacterized protein IUM83_03734 [Phytophthora cinnamomi]|uniref:uncharacterized protein n=1 Tax=Phytophthora cinnamomi TaxID=4785 RepID=UPI00355A36F8|nr:hypothetical protein IUM83_03734 [Phytophthora cinnamomi]
MHLTKLAAYLAVVSLAVGSFVDASTPQAVRQLGAGGGLSISTTGATTTQQSNTHESILPTDTATHQQSTQTGHTSTGTGNQGQTWTQEGQAGNQRDAAAAATPRPDDSSNQGPQGQARKQAGDQTRVQGSLTRTGNQGGDAAPTPCSGDSSDQGGQAQRGQRGECNHARGGKTSTDATATRNNGDDNSNQRTGIVAAHNPGSVRGDRNTVTQGGASSETPRPNDQGSTPATPATETPVREVATTTAATSTTQGPATKPGTTC